jgi:hypothetical protein
LKDAFRRLAGTLEAMPDVILIKKATRWFDQEAGGEALEISCSIPAGLPSTAGAALFLFDFAGPVSAFELEGTGLFMSDQVGPFIYLQGRHRQTHFRTRVRLPKEALRRIGVKLWNFGEPIEITELAFRTLDSRERNFYVNISVDVEALPHRAPDNHVDTLIFGRSGGGEHGIREQMALFSGMGVPATFYLECAQAARYGSVAIAEAGRAILDGGFDLQLHLHAELLAEAERWSWNRKGTIPSLENLDEAQARRAMGFAVAQYRAIAGNPPRAFRAGSYQFNRFTLDAGERFGIAAFSNYRSDHAAGNTYDFYRDPPVRPFRWSNGIFEFPITISPEPLSVLSPQTVWDRILYDVDVNGNWCATIVIHSWSFLHRNWRGHHEWRDDTLKEQMREIIERAPARATFVSLDQVLGLVAAGDVEISETRNADDLIRRNPDRTMPS